MGHSIVGDTRYSPKKVRPVPGFPGRLWLHAQRLELPDGRVLVAPLPRELKRSLEILREVVEEGP
jgi:23S rRNA-/tRNA-specific pseudouridylate synthase